MKHSNHCWWRQFSLGLCVRVTHVSHAAAETAQGWFHGAFELNQAWGPVERGISQHSHPGTVSGGLDQGTDPAGN